jgi:putative redox protein
MQVKVQWTAPQRFDATSLAGGSRLTMDTRPDAGGTGAGPTPMETVLMALAGCTGIDVVSILNKMRENLEGLSIDVSADRAPEHPKVFTKIHVRYVAWGRGLNRAQVERATTLSRDKYCPVTAMIGKTAEISHEVVVFSERPKVI